MSGSSEAGTSCLDNCSDKLNRAKEKVCQTWPFSKQLYSTLLQPRINNAFGWVLQSPLQAAWAADMCWTQHTVLPRGLCKAMCY